MICLFRGLVLLLIIATGLMGSSNLSAQGVESREVLRYSSNHSQSKAGPFESIAEADLPREARQTMDLIRKGGPFPYAQDGTAFRNREKRLPARPRDHYKEFTVRTPGARDRGARRIISGKSGEFYYTADHYRTFKLIRERK